jgi:hypothetical protein
MTKTDIANLALSKIGESLIDDIADTGDKASRLAALHYNQARREILREHFWGFAMTQKIVTGNVAAPFVSGVGIPAEMVGYYVAGAGVNGTSYVRGDFSITRNSNAGYAWAIYGPEPEGGGA